MLFKSREDLFLSRTEDVEVLFEMTATFNYYQEFRDTLGNVALHELTYMPTSEAKSLLRRAIKRLDVVWADTEYLGVALDSIGMKQSPVSAGAVLACLLKASEQWEGVWSVI